MTVEDQGKFVLISLTQFSKKTFDILKEKINSLEKSHIVLRFYDTSKNNAEDFLVFLQISKDKKENGTSFVMVLTEFNIDRFPDELNIVPTLQEAEDIIDMENMERELGF